MYTNLIDAQSLQENLDDPNWVIIDSRAYIADHQKGRALYHSGHIPGAIFVDMETDLSGEITPETGRHPLPNIECFFSLLSRLSINPSKQVVVYDDMGGGMAGRLWWMLRSLGHQNVAVLNGGIQAWNQQGGQLSTEEVLIEADQDVSSEYAAEFSEYLTASQLQQLLRDTDDLQLVDARPEQRFLGKTEPVDPVAGHVPGAVNRPLGMNLTAEGLFKSPETLRQEWSDFLDISKPIVHMCGSGVTACHNMLAMSYAGLEPGQIYAGSWSEWIRFSGQYKAEQ